MTAMTPGPLRVLYHSIEEACHFSEWEREMRSADWAALDAEDELQLLYGTPA